MMQSFRDPEVGVTLGTSTRSQTRARYPRYPGAPEHTAARPVTAFLKLCTDVFYIADQDVKCLPLVWNADLFLRHLTKIKPTVQS